MTAWMRLLAVITGSGVILSGAAWAAGPLLRRRPALRGMVWLAVSVRLLIPYAPVWGWLIRMYPAQGLGGPYETARRLAHFGAARVLTFLWLFGIFAALAPRVAAYVRLRLLVRGPSVRRVGPEWQDVWDSLDTGRHKPVLLYCRSVAFPLTMGVLKRVVVLPDRAFAPEERRCLLLYVLYHIRRHDAVRQGVAQLAACVHWFNPAAWYACRAVRRAAEQACAVEALRGLGEGERPIGRALLRCMLERQPPWR